MKGIVRSLRDMKIQLNTDAKPTKSWPYHLNPKYKEEAWKELDKMLDARIIFHVEESD